jgi:hypothetical protein
MLSLNEKHALILCLIKPNHISTVNLNIFNKLTDLTVFMYTHYQFFLRI